MKLEGMMVNANGMFVHNPSITLSKDYEDRETLLRNELKTMFNRMEEYMNVQNEQCLLDNVSIGSKVTSVFIKRFVSGVRLYAHIIH